MSVVERGLLPFKVSICGVAELEQFAGDVTHILGILDPGTPQPDGYVHHPKALRDEFRFYDIVTEQDGRSMPTEHDVAAILKVGEKLAVQPVRHLLVHCYAGVSRSTASAVTLMAQRNPARAADIFAALGDIRPKAWPNSVMIAHADRLLNLGGTLVEALRLHHIAVAHRHPEVRTLISSVGRGHELPAEYAAEGSDPNEPV
ncbi:protein-tyrosine-phosphatase [Ferrovibrio terrae]|uniref:tyrosine phosphatase family protein n=1 Tax=Ferrovibrio terrae TaxID=2594003 RepID=UPI0031382F95